MPEVPPRRLASFALDSGVAVVEDVTPVLLQSTLRRTLDAVVRMVELRVDGRAPQVTPGPTCGGVSCWRAASRESPAWRVFTIPTGTDAQPANDAQQNATPHLQAFSTASRTPRLPLSQTAMHDELVHRASRHAWDGGECDG